MEFAAAAIGKLASVMTGAAAGGGAAGAGSTVASILSGGATALSVLMGIGAANEEATGLELAAADTRQEIADEALNNLDRRNSLKRALIDAVGEQDVAFAASGVDLSFGTPAEARKRAADDADRALALDNATTLTRTSRLEERARLYRISARSRRRSGLLEGLARGLGGAADIAYRG